eukprot:gene9305-9470_t
MKALIKARFRLQHKFDSDIVAAAGFMDDSSNGVPANNVFLQLDIVKTSARQFTTSVAARALQPFQLILNVASLCVPRLQQVLKLARDGSSGKV